MTYISCQREFQLGGEKTVKMILVGVIPSHQETTNEMYIKSIINPRGDYIIKGREQAYLLLSDTLGIDSLSENELNERYEKQIDNYLKMSHEEVQINHLYPMNIKAQSSMVDKAQP